MYVIDKHKQIRAGGDPASMHLAPERDDFESTLASWPGLVPAIHAEGPGGICGEDVRGGRAWMAGTSPAMTTTSPRFNLTVSRSNASRSPSGQAERLSALSII